MKSCRSSKTLVHSTVLVVVMMIIATNPIRVESSLHRVGGGRYTWKPDMNFSDWASHERFYVGDWLYFGFNRTQHSVLEVNQTAYEQCIETNFITNITKGGRDVFQLVVPKPYFFICGRGHCHNGMKLAVTVLPQTPTAPATPLAPATPTSIAASGSTTAITATSWLALPLSIVLIST